MLTRRELLPGLSFPLTVYELCPVLESNLALVARATRVNKTLRLARSCRARSGPQHETAAGALAAHKPGTGRRDMLQRG